MRQHVLGDAVAAVGELDDDLARLLLKAERDAQFAAFGHRVARVEQEV